MRLRTRSNVRQRNCGICDELLVRGDPVRAGVAEPMSMVGFKAQNHPQQVAVRDALDPIDDRATPPEWFAELQERFKFTLDAAAAAHNTKLPRYFNYEANGLAQSWAGERVWCNPPFSNLAAWVKKAHEESTGCPLIVLLLP